MEALGSAVRAYGETGKMVPAVEALLTSKVSDVIANRLAGMTVTKALPKAAREQIAKVAEGLFGQDIGSAIEAVKSATEKGGSGGEQKGCSK